MEHTINRPKPTLTLTLTEDEAAMLATVLGHLNSREDASTYEMYCVLDDFSANAANRYHLVTPTGPAIPPLRLQRSA